MAADVAGAKMRRHVAVYIHTLWRTHKYMRVCVCACVRVLVCVHVCAHVISEIKYPV